MDGILRISSSEVEGIGTVVLAQEQGLSQQLARIDALEQECQADTANVENSLAALSSLMQLVSEHLERSRQVRDRLQLLTFNSIIEASRLGTQADAILEISQSIKRIASLWSEMTDQSGTTQEQILGLVEKAKTGMDAFSQASNDGLRKARAETKVSLDNLRTAAAFASKQATKIEARIGEFKARIAAVCAVGDSLDASFAHINKVLSELEALRSHFENYSQKSLGSRDQEEVEAMFSCLYTTEMEREVLRAALNGAPLPVMQQNLVGNDVELF
jgi:chromosome segregation ATPase